MKAYILLLSLMIYSLSLHAGFEQIMELPDNYIVQDDKQGRVFEQDVLDTAIALSKDPNGKNALLRLAQKLRNIRSTIGKDISPSVGKYYISNTVYNILSSVFWKAMEQNDTATIKRLSPAFVILQETFDKHKIGGLSTILINILNSNGQIPLQAVESFLDCLSPQELRDCMLTQMFYVEKTDGIDGIKGTSKIVFSSILHKIRNPQTAQQGLEKQTKFYLYEVLRDSITFADIDTTWLKLLQTNLRPRIVLVLEGTKQIEGQEFFTETVRAGIRY